MAWIFKTAAKRGKQLDMVIENAVGGMESETKNLTYAFPMYEGQTQAKFKAAVKKEVRALLDQINAVVEPLDATAEYQDL